MGVFQSNVFQNNVFQGPHGLVTIDTTTYSPHPINCMMAGTKPLGNWKRITEWSIPNKKIKITTGTSRGGSIPRINPFK